MNKETKKIYYCLDCKRWAGQETKCSICGKDTVAKELPQRRDTYYYIDGVPDPLPSVTNIINVVAKPALIYWAAETAAKLALENPFLTAKEAAGGIYKKRDTAAAKGSDVHKIISKGKYDIEKITDENILGYIQSYEKFKGSMPHKILKAEETVYSTEYGFAGTLDCLAEFADGKIWILDYKTGKGIYPEDLSLQLSAYRQAVEEMGVVDHIDGMAGIHIRPNKTFSFVEVDDNLEIFLAAKKIWEWKNQ